MAVVGCAALPGVAAAVTFNSTEIGYPAVSGQGANGDASFAPGDFRPVDLVPAGLVPADIVAAGIVSRAGAGTGSLDACAILDVIEGLAGNAGSGADPLGQFKAALAGLCPDSPTASSGNGASASGSSSPSQVEAGVGAAAASSVRASAGGGGGGGTASGGGSASGTALTSATSLVDDIAPGQASALSLLAFNPSNPSALQPVNPAGAQIAVAPVPLPAALPALLLALGAFGLIARRKA